MKIIVLTSSRADYGIYLPLLKKLHADPFFDLSLYVFGTHLSPLHGYTIDQIKKDSFHIKHQIESLVMGDSPEAIATSIGLTQTKFASIWAKEKENSDLVFCLGDRYEMFAAVMASIPFSIPIAHIHGGETTLGAIDNIFRHALTLASSYHFTATEKSASRVKEIRGTETNVFNVGSLSLDNIDELTLLTPTQFYSTYKIDLAIPTILFTFHPETISFEKNKEYIKVITDALKKIPNQIIVTMPNADTYGTIIRKELLDLADKQKTIFLIENFGIRDYFSCMKHCWFVMGNSSSGIIEAASFGKYVINLGDRQKGREQGKNVINCSIEQQSILNAIESVKKMPVLSTDNIYGSGHASEKIIHLLKTNYNG